MSDAGRSILIVVIIALVAGGYYFGVYAPSKPAPEPEIPETIASYLDVEPITPDPDTLPETVYRFTKMPDFTYYTMDNHRISLSDYKGQKKVVLYFWRTWNRASTDHLFILQRFWLQYRNEIEVIAINCEPLEDVDKVREILDEKGVQFPVIHDPTEKLRDLYFHEMIPYYILVDKDGNFFEDFINTNYELEDVILCTYDPTRKSKSGVTTPSAGSGCGRCGG